jgi:hypothetical protein
MSEYKSPDRRLVRLFKRSRDKWRERAKSKQKRIRALETKVRDISKSRDQWRQKAKQAQQELAELKKKGHQSKTAPETSPKDEAAVEEEEGQPPEESWSRAKGHHYPVEVVQLGIEQVTHSLNSLRGSQKTFELFSQHFCLGAPSFSSIRHWLLRVGLYELKQRPVYEEDLIMMLDMTLELGTLKCLLILGLPVSRLAQTGFALGHQDVDVLEIAVLSGCTGEVINQALTKVSQRMRPPVQIVSDQGSDLKKGISLYQQKHPGVVWTYDVTHQMALLFEKELSDDERYQSFAQRCARARQQLKQTPLYFLAPPKQRAKARYLNVEQHIHWAQQVLHYQAQADFSAIIPHFRLDKTALAQLQTQLDPETWTALTNLEETLYPDRPHFCHHLSQFLGPERWAEYGPALCQVADLGRRYFAQKLGWVQSYQADLPTYAQLMTLVNTVEQQLKQKGLAKTSKALFAQQTTPCTLSPRLQLFRNHILTYLQTQIELIPADQTWLASSDVLESIFGKYKLFSSERPFKEIGQSILTIPLFTAKLTLQRVKQALETIHTSDVNDWAKQLFGQSMLSKRRSLLNLVQSTQNVQENYI